MDPEVGGRGQDPPPEKSQSYSPGISQSLSFITNIVLDPLKTYEAMKLAFSIGQSSVREQNTI